MIKHDVWLDIGTRKFYIHDVYEGKVYSGHGEGLNNWDMEAVKNVGPCPRGLYRLSGPFQSPRTGPMIFRLVPIDHNACDRTDLEIHGDNSRLDFSASDGCIIAGHAMRKELRDGMILKVG
jgi:hypothetical protein